MTACTVCAASPCHAHARIKRANEQDQRTHINQQIAAFDAAIEARWPGPPLATPKHPAPGCPCHGCDGRDRAMEARAEERAAAGRGDYAGLAEQEWAEYRREMRDDWWTP
jgi:hypothetical protein